MLLEEKKTCDTCFWRSRDGYCTEGGRPPRPCKKPCEKHKSYKSTK